MEVCKENNSKRNTVRNICVTAMFLAFLVVGSWTSIQTGPIKITLQLLAIFLIGLFLNLKQSMTLIFSYIFLGLMGLPIFASFLGGLSQIYSPTFGFILGFIPGLIIMNLFNRYVIKSVNSANKRIFYTVLSCFICLLLVYVCGISYGSIILNLVNNSNYGFIKLLSVFILPYLPFDVIKIIVAILSYEIVRKYARRYN